MKKKRNLLNIKAMMVFMLILSFKQAIPQGSGIQRAKELSRQSQELVEKKMWDEATEILQEELQKLGSGEQAKESRAILNFSLGYLNEQISQEYKDIDERNASLAKAAAFYKDALTDIPNNLQIMNNLVIVLRALGQWEEAINLLEHAKDIDAEESSSYLIAIGDLYREKGEKNRAMDYYWRASKLNQADETPRWRILSLYGEYDKLTDNALRELYDYCVELKEINQPALARDGLEQVINGSIKSSNKSWAEKALIDWAELGATQEWISEESLGSLPDEQAWNSPAMIELRKVLRLRKPEKPEEPENKPVELGLAWWGSSNLRLHVIALVLKAVGSQLLADGDLERAVQVYELALKTAPTYDKYDHDELQNKALAAVVITQELASLYYNYSTLDPQEEKFNKLEVALYSDKAKAYANRDLEAIQRFHTVLGLIYAEKGQWTSGQIATNAFFQLEHALDTAKERVKEDPGNFQPLPHLQSILAKGYGEKERTKEAYTTYLDAAMGYMDLDDLETAHKTVETAENLSFSAENIEKQRMGGVKNILNSRQTIPKLQRDNFEAESSDYHGKKSEYSWLYVPNNTGLDELFLNRQRFKVFSDLGNRASQLNVRRDSLYLHTCALGVIRTENNLTNMDDIVRLEQLKSTVLKTVGVEESRKTIRTGRNLEKDYNYSNGKIWRLASPYGARPIEVGLSRDLLLAGVIGNRLSREVESVPESPMLLLKDGKVTVLRQNSDTATPEKLNELLKNIEGVQQIEIQRRRSR